MTAPMVSSATLRVEACGALNTGMPRLAASWIDTWSVPTERQPMASIRRACSQVLLAHLGARSHAEDVRRLHHRAQLVPLDGAGDDLDGIAAFLEGFGGTRVDVLQQRDADAVSGKGRRGHVL